MCQTNRWTILLVIIMKRNKVARERSCHVMTVAIV